MNQITLSKNELEEALAFASYGGYDVVTIKTTGTSIGTKVEVAVAIESGYEPRWEDITEYSAW